MKKFFLASFVLLAVWGCSKKATPAKSETGSTETTTAVTTRSVASAEVIAAGKLVYDAKCGKCHSLHAPDEYTAAKWVPIMESMAPKARLTDTEKANALAYVQSGAKP